MGRSLRIAGIASGAQSLATEIINTGGNGGGGKVVMAFILGAVLLAVAVVAFFMWDNFKSGAAPSVPSAIHITVKGK